MKLLFDLDAVLYKGLFAGGGLGYFAGLRACDNIIDNVLNRFNYPEFYLVTGGEKNFRKDICSTYKAHRKAEKPRYLHDSKRYYIKYWNAIEAHGVEADDVIAQMADQDSVIISEDHDFFQLGVPMFNVRYWTLNEIKNPWYWWWLQTLTGCKSDNVPGVKNPEKLKHKKQPNFTEDTAGKLLEGKTPEEMKAMVQSQYKIIYGDEWFEKYDMACRLLWLKRSPEDEYFMH
jgi:hypothetical protein